MTHTTSAAIETKQVKMAYRIYKQRYVGCPTLNDYDANSKTITAIIPKRERLAVYDKSVWRKISYGYQLIADPTKEVRLRGSAGISQTFEAIWCEELTRGDIACGRWNGWRSKDFTSRQNAFDFLLSK